MNDHYGEEGERWVPIFWSKNTHEIEISEANHHGLDKNGKGQGKLEKLSLEMDHEVLSCPIIPNICVIGEFIFIG